MLSKQTISLIIKISIVFVSIFFLYKQISIKSSADEFDIKTIYINLSNNFYLSFIVFFMMFVNWFLEALKWRFLISKIEKVSILRSLRAVFSGITVSAFTPNRIGEYGGRIFCLEKADRVKGALITVIGSMAQLITTIIFGLIGLLYLPSLLPNLNILFTNFVFAYPILVFSVILLCVLLVVLYLNISFFSVIFSKFRFLKKFKKYNKVFTYYNSSELLEVLIYSFARYLVFSSQFYILLKIFNVNITYIDSLTLNSLMLMTITVIPNYLPIFEFAQRGIVAISIFSLLSNNSIGVFSATFTMWATNLLLPALVGTIFIFTLKFFRT